MNYKIFLIILATIAVLITSVPSKAFEDTFQYYTGGVITSNWLAVHSGSGSGSGSIVTYGATYNRNLNLNVAISGTCPGSSVETVTSLTGTSSNYWSFNLRYNAGADTSAMPFNVIFYDNTYTQIWVGTLFSTSFGDSAKNGLWELSSSGGSIYARLNGVDRGIVGGAVSGIPYYIAFQTSVSGSGCGSYGISFYIDDITTSGYISGLGTEVTTHTLTESNLPTTDVSYSINTFPFADYTSSSFRNIIQKYTGSIPTTIITTNIKNSTVNNTFQGFTTYNRETQLTSSDTNYGLYFSYTQKNNITVASDYFFLIPPGAVNTITSDTTATIGQQEIIYYSISTPDFVGSSYSLNIYSLSSLIVSLPIATGVATGTVTWDTTGNSAGLYFIVLSKTTSGIQTDLAYTTITLVPTLLIRGTVYDAVNATTLSGVNINFSQGTTWYNTTSNGNGSYNLSGLTVALLTQINASKSNWIHNNYSFTPLAPQIYTINLYLISTNFNCSIAAGGGNSTNTCINGMVENNPYHQAIGGATVFLRNSSYFANTTSNTTTGYYQFLNLSDDNLTYVVNATKSGFMNSQDYNATTINQTDVQQIILMSEIYTLTIQAQDASNTNTLLDFLLLFNLANYNTTTGQITISNLIYGQYPAIVSAADYISSSQTILVDSTKTVTFYLSPISPPTSSTIFKTLPHDVAFIVQDLAFNKKPGVYVTAQGYNTTVGSWTWLADLIGIDFDLIPINNMSMIGITGTDGSIDFKMDGSIYYILTFSGGNISNKTWSGYPTQYQYYIIVPTTLYGTFTNNVDQFSTMITTVSSKTINSTHAYINASHNDSMNQTSSIIIYLNKSIIGDPNNQTNLQIKNGGTNATYNASFIVNPYAGNDYIINFHMVHSSGTVDRSYGVSFPQAAILSYFNPISILMLLIGLIIFFSGIFGQTSTEQGAGIIVGFVWLLSGMGLYVNLNLGVSFYLGLTLATVIAILMNMNSRARKEGMS